MAPRVPPIRRLLPLVAAIVIATTGVLPAAASAPVESTAVPLARPAAAPSRVDGRVDGRTSAAVGTARRAVQRAPASTSAAVRSVVPPSVVVPASIDVPVATARVEQKVVPAPAPTASRATGSSTAGSTYRGRNHMWIPSLGISKAVSFYACSRSTALAHVVYRWGCGGTNNVYLMGHAASVLRPLHDAYVSGRLRKGMKVIYADGNGRVRTYSVSYWKVVRPDGDVAWAYAAQARPSMTLQTCVGANNEWRLVVRLIASG